MTEIRRLLVVDQDDVHAYQPGFLFIPFGGYEPEEIVKPRRRFLAGGIDLVLGEIDRVDPSLNTVTLTDGRLLAFDYLVIASGTNSSDRPYRSRARRVGISSRSS